MTAITASLIAGTLALAGASAAQAQSGHDLSQRHWFKNASTETWKGPSNCTAGW